MDKETKELLKRTLDMTDEKALLKFAKSYAAKDQAFAEAIIEKFLPVENTVDIKKAVEDCFKHKKKGGARRYGPSLDWTAIRKDSKRLLKQLNYLNDEGDVETAANGALLFLQKLADEFDGDCVYEEYNYDNSNYGNEQALELLRDVLINAKSMTKDRKLGIVDDLKRLADSDVYSNYLPCDIDELIDDVHTSLLTDEELLKQIDKDIMRSEMSTEKAYYVEWKINLLRQMGREEEAEKTTDENLDLDQICTLKYERLIAAKDFDAAKRFCQSRVDPKKDGWHEQQEWWKRLLELCQKSDDKEGATDAALWLFAHGNIRSEERKEYFRICREHTAKEKWPAVRDKMFGQLGGRWIDGELIFDLYIEEHLNDQIFSRISKMSTYSGWSYSDTAFSGGEKLKYFAKYASHLTELQKEELETSLLETIRTDASRANTRDRYAQVAKGLHLLGTSCKKGLEDARRLAAKILRDNPKKPAYRDEIEKYAELR